MILFWVDKECMSRALDLICQKVKECQPSCQPTKTIWLTFLMVASHGTQLYHINTNIRMDMDGERRSFDSQEGCFSKQNQTSPILSHNTIPASNTKVHSQCQRHTWQIVQNGYGAAHLGSYTCPSNVQESSDIPFLPDRRHRKHNRYNTRWSSFCLIRVDDIPSSKECEKPHYSMIEYTTTYS